MKIKIQYSDFIKTLTERQNKDIKDYNLVIKLQQQKYSKKEIKDKTKVSEDKLHQWRNTDIKPSAVKILNETKSRGYFDYVSKENIEPLAYIIGYNLGDGNISRNLCNSWFYGVNKDLEDIKKLLIEFKVNPVIYTYKINNGKMAVHDRVFSRFLVSLGSVIGDKTKSKIRIPDWVLATKKASPIKKRFLQGLFDSELSNISKIKNKPNSYQSLKFYTSKHKNYLNEGKIFLDQIRTIIEEFGVTTTEVKEDRKYLRKRDGSSMQQLYFIIHSNRINLYKFIKKLGFLYNSKRRENSIQVLKDIEKEKPFGKCVICGKVAKK